MTIAAVIASEPRDERGGDKRPGAFRTISEVADELDMPQHVLRFWESRFAQIKPVKRAGGRRYYRPEDVDLVRGIRRLLHGQGYTIKGAQRVLRERGIRFVQSVGRGEAEAGLPTPVEREADEVSGADSGLAASDLHELEDALEELRACRAALSEIGACADDDDR